MFFHGYGADGADLRPLAREIPVGKPWRWEFPDGPLELPFGGRAWFPIDVEAIEAAQRTGRSVDFSKRTFDGFDVVRKSVQEFLDYLGVPMREVVLGGFSQGAMLAVDLALRAEESPLGLVILSGNLMNEAEWKKLAPRRKGLRFFQSHGIADPILGFQGARRLEALLAEAGLEGRLLAFEGGHAIPLEAVERLGGFLDGLG